MKKKEAKPLTPPQILNEDLAFKTEEYEDELVPPPPRHQIKAQVFSTSPKLNL